MPLQGGAPSPWYWLETHHTPCPTKKPAKRAEKAKRQDKAPSTQAGAFVREEIDEIREGKHGARSAKQAIAIGLSKARRAGVDLAPPAKGRAKESTRKKAEQDRETGQHERTPRHSSAKAKATTQALKREPRHTVSHAALSKQAKESATRRSPAERSAAAKKAARTRRQD